MTDYVITKVENYNDDPAPDDGTVVSANQITWAGLKDEYFDPIKDAIETLDSEADDSFDSIPDLVGTQTIWMPIEKMSFITSDYTNGSVSINVRLLDNSGSAEAVGFYSMPLNWDGGEIVVTPYVVEHLSDTGDVVMEVSTILADDDDNAISGFGSASNSTTTMPGTQGDIAILDPITHDVGGTAGEERLLVIKVNRNSSGTYSSNIGFVGIKIEYQVTSYVISE